MRAGNTVGSLRSMSKDFLPYPVPATPKLKPWLIKPLVPFHSSPQYDGINDPRLQLQVVVRDSLISLANELGTVPACDHFGTTYQLEDDITSAGYYCLGRNTFLGCHRVW
jgi:hypothetical protein